MEMATAAVVLFLAVISAGRAEPSPSDHVQLDNPIDEIIRKALETLKANMSQGFPQWDVPPLDPLKIANIPLNLSSSAITLKGDFSDLTLVDLSTFNIDKIHTNIFTLNVDVALSLPELMLTGSYAIDGLIAQLFPLYGSGPLSIRVTNIPLEVVADLNLNGTGYQVKTLDFTFGIETLDIQMHNLFNSEDLSAVIDGFADDLGPLLVEILVNDTRRDLIPKIIDIINGLLSEVKDGPTLLGADENRKMPRGLLPKSSHSIKAMQAKSEASANEFFDRMLANARTVIIQNGLDPITLPDETIEIFGTGIKLHDGHLDGIGNVHRTGDAIMSYDGEWLAIEGHIGFNGLGAGYSCKIEVLHIGPDVTASADITETSIYFSAKISSKTLEIVLVGFDIENVGKIEVDISGLGPFDWLLEPLSQAIINLLKGFVVKLINVIAKPILASFLSAIDLMYFLNHII